jgi:NAD(P)-dependent dehydrogenase (short-subunit alcohol dehydrogenase family)
MVAQPHLGRTALVTGAASGIGRAAALRLAEDGADLVIADRQPADGLVAEIQALGRKALAVVCDISSPRDVADLHAQVAASFPRCDILLNNAGVYATRAFAEITFEEWRRTFAINLDGMFLVTQAFIGGMRRNRFGRIINIASNTLGSVVPYHADYIASKGGVVGLTRALASEFGIDGITVNAIAPGLTRTPGTQHPTFRPRGVPIEEAFERTAATQSIKRTQVPADLAGVVSFLASDDAAFMSGQTLYVDGGLVRV